MIISIIVFIFCVLGVYGNYNNNLTFLYVGSGVAILETILELFSGQARNLTTQWLAILMGCGMAMAGESLIRSIALCLCFENVIMFVLGSLFILFTYKKIKKEKRMTEINQYNDYFFENLKRENDMDMIDN